MSETSVSKDEEKEIVAPVYRTIKLNVAAVYLQLKNYERTRDACDLVWHNACVVIPIVIHEMTCMLNYWR